ncbi:phage tail tape measure protein [Pseudomonas aeruginosa]|uniref:phage tail tape measure protein n=1 Tax=Pseudomonas aeruginosa TaxID=287 RepID=UPI00106727E7|nr:phage tail tape measure protein [Pseudomonas aeruginosa]TEP56617.1 phage tail tape measure protein [Pseudomonas aeruginosa]
MANSLGTLTLDLVARIGGFTGPLDKAGRDSEKWRKQVERDAAAISVAFIAASTAAATALTAMTVAAVRQAEEFTRLATISGTTTEAFQRYAVGAQAVGIEQEKLGDIFKDTQDKVGDFLSTGGGELKDFFENIAPKVGVTAEAFQNLSGPQALQLFASTLEKANLSQAEMTFYMEGIADEATALLPLLRNNGEAFRELGDSAAAAGAIMDNETIRAANELSAAAMFLQQEVQGASNQIMSELLPSLAGIALGFLEATEKGNGFKVVGEAVSTVLEVAASAAVGAYSAFQLLGKGLAGLVFIASEVPNGFDAVKQAAATVSEELDATAQRSANALSQIVNGVEEGGRVSKTADLLEQTRKAAVGTAQALTKSSDDADKAAKRRAKAIADQIAALQIEAATVGMTTEQQRLYKLALDGATESQLAQAKTALEIVDAFEKQKKSQEDYKRLIQDLRTDEERLLDTTKERLAVLDAMKGLSDEERNRVASRIASESFTSAPTFGGVDAVVAGPQGELDKIDKAQEELEKWYETQLELLNANREAKAELTAQWDEQELKIKQEHEDALAAIEKSRQQVTLSANEEFFGNLSGLAKTFFGEQSGLYKAAFVAEKSFAIAKALINVPKTASDAYSAMAGIPIVGPALGIAAAAAAVTAQLAQVASIRGVNLSGQAHDGIMSVPEDGTWNLKKGERVTTAETSAKLDRTLDDVQRNQASAGAPTVNLIEDRSRAGQVNTRRQDDQYIIDVVVADLFGDGRTSKAIGSSFGMRRSGT